MSKFSDIAKGTRARKHISLPLAGASFDETTGRWVGGVVELDVRVLGPDDDAAILRNARADAIVAGVTDPEDGNPIYDGAIKAHTVARACVDRDSPENAPTAFFDGGVKQIVESEIITRDHVAYLFEQQLQWQDECSPRQKNLSTEQFIETIRGMAGGNPDFFVSLRPGLQWSCMRILASLHLDSLARNSSSGTTAEPPSSAPAN